MCDSKCINAFPAVTILLIIIWSYFTFVVQVCFHVIEEYGVKFCAYLVCVHVFVVPMLAMFFLCMCHKEWTVPDVFYIPSDEFAAITAATGDRQQYNLLLAFLKRQQIRVYTRSSSGMIRFCIDCQQVKPDRTHHCNKCGVCVLRMDHHCPWVNNCIGFTNYKYFLMLILYSGFYCAFVFGASFEYTLHFILTMRDFKLLNILILSIATLVLGITMFSLLIFHVKMIASNETTIEAMYPPTFVGAGFSFDKGCQDNFEETCSKNPVYWCLPIDTFQGDGTEFDVYSY